MAATRPTTAELAVAVLAGVAGLAAGFAASGWTGAFLVVPIDSAIVSATPAAVVNASIETLGETGHLLHHSLAVFLSLALLAGLALLAVRLSIATETVAVGGWGAGFGTGAAALAVTGGLLSATVTGIAVGIVVAVGRAVATDAVHDIAPDRQRRRLLRIAGGVGIGSVLGGLVGRWQTERLRLDAPPLEREETVGPMVDRAAETALGLEGSPGPISTIEEFYSVDISAAPPLLSAEAWSLTVDGAVETSLNVEYDELRSMDALDEYLTLRCIGERLDGDLMDTAVWTCVPVSRLLDRADPQGEFVTVQGADDYYATYPISYIEDGLLAYGMNGQRLPREHGYPVRLLVPGRWGKLNVKWITSITVTTEKEVGYWEDRGWHGEEPVNTVAKLWTERRLDDGRIELGGHAYAGTRGIDRVEVSTDGGTTWEEATLAEPLPGEDVARQWRYVFEPTGSHEVFVRAVDGTGTVQTREQSPPFPDGATGWVSTTIEAQE